MGATKVRVSAAPQRANRPRASTRIPPVGPPRRHLRSALELAPTDGARPSIAVASAIRLRDEFRRTRVGAPSASLSTHTVRAAAEVRQWDDRLTVSGLEQVRDRQPLEPGNGWRLPSGVRFCLFWLFASGCSSLAVRFLVFVLGGEQAAAPPPALPLIAWAALPDLSGRSRKGGPARQRWTPLPRSSGVMGIFGRGRGGRPVSLRTQRLQRNS